MDYIGFNMGGWFVIRLSDVQSQRRSITVIREV